MRRKRVFALTILGLALAGTPVTTKANVDVNVKNPVKASALIDPSEYRRTLDDLTKTVPLTYNEPVKRMINYYASSHKAKFSKVLGLSEYYFPIYEKVFKERGVPEEIKYLSIVESALNPFALSSAQAGGLWQFLEPVGKIYGLQINETIDERRDPVLACNAAASYLLDSYEMYKDWLLAIASYNCGRNNIRWAMEKAPSATTYWEIRQYLPAETQSYVPAFIATVYLMNNSKRHGIYPVKPDFNISTREIFVNRPVSLYSVAKAVGVEASDLIVLNAAYKNQIVNGSVEKPGKLVIPVIKDYLHNALCDVLTKPGKLEDELRLVYTVPVETKVASVVSKKTSPGSNNSNYKAVDTYVKYKVKEGDTLSSIVEQFNSTEAEVKVLNRLKQASVKPGMVLTIIQG